MRGIKWSWFIKKVGWEVETVEIHGEQFRLKIPKWPLLSPSGKYFCYSFMNGSWMFQIQNQLKITFIWLRCETVCWDLCSFVLYCIYGSVRAIPTYRVYRLYDEVLSLATASKCGPAMAGAAGPSEPPLQQECIVQSMVLGGIPTCTL